MRQSVRGRLRAALLSPALLLGAHGSGAAASISVHNADHPGFGRIELELPEGMTAMAAQQGDRVFVHFLSGAPFDRIDAGSFAARNLRASVALADGVDLTVTHGARLKVTRLSDRLVLDLLDPVRQPEPPGPRKPIPPVSDTRLEAAPAIPTVKAFTSDAVPAPAPVSPSPVSPSAPPPALPSMADRPPSPAPAEAALSPRDVTRSELPALWASSSAPLALAATTTGAVLSLPFSVGTGAASFQRGEWSYVVFDERRPIDLSGQGQGEDAVFAGATLLLLPDATLLRFKADLTGCGNSASQTGVGTIQ